MLAAGLLAPATRATAAAPGTINGRVTLATRLRGRPTATSAYAPRVVAITRGSTVEIPNFDPYFHNVFSLSGAAPFDLGRYPDDQSRARQFTRTGVVKLNCHIDSQMSATVLVLAHPYFVSPDPDGRFTIPAVPPGDYSLVGWHERAGEYATHITVSFGQTTAAELSLPLTEAR